MSIQFNSNISATIDDSGKLTIQFSQTPSASASDKFILAGILTTFWGPKLTTTITSPEAFKQVRTIASQVILVPNTDTKTIISTIPENNSSNIDKMLFARYENLVLKDITNKIETKLPACERTFVVSMPSDLQVSASSLPAVVSNGTTTSTKFVSSEDDVLIINVSRLSIVGVKKVRLNFIN